MSDTTDELIREIATKHGIGVSRNDPILIIQTMHERLIKQFTEAQEELLAAFRSEIEQIAFQSNEQAKQLAERALTASINGCKQAMDQSMTLGAQLAAASVRDQIGDSIAKLTTHSAITRQTATMNLVAAAVTLCAALIVVWSK